MIRRLLPALIAAEMALALILLAVQERRVWVEVGYGLEQWITDGFAGETDQIVVIAGVPFQVAGSTNILRIAPCDESLIIRTDPESWS